SPATEAARLARRKPSRRSPAFGLVLGYTLLYLAAIVLVPLAGLFVKTALMSFDEIWAAVTSARVVASYAVRFGSSLAAAVLNTGLGLIVAWVLVRYRFFGRRVLDAMIDLPFALPTAVAGIALTAIFSDHGWLGAPLAALGIHVAFTRLGIVVALV